MRKKSGARTRQTVFARSKPDPARGLSTAQVKERAEAGAVNAQNDGLTTSVPRIIFKNCFTFFNLINLFLVIVMVLAGHPRNTLFFGIVICNTAMGIIQELRAKKTLDSLSVLAKARCNVLRDGAKKLIPQDEIVLDDIVLLTAGDQIAADGTLIEANGLEVDESLLTGEANRIHKEDGEEVLSGSYVTAGRGVMLVTAVGADSYANSLTAQAKQKQKKKSKLLALLNRIILVMSIVIIPLGLLLFFSKINMGLSTSDAVLSAATAMVGMIPGGLVLLTGVTLTVGAMNLAKKRALVQSLDSIETLARVDVLCLDKTGTITDGDLVFERLELPPEAPPPLWSRQSPS